MSEYSRGSSRRRPSDTSDPKRSKSTGTKSSSAHRSTGSSASSRSSANSSPNIRSASGRPAGSGHSAGRGTGSSHSAGSGRSSGGNHGSGGGYHRRKKKGLDITQILMYGFGALIVIFCVVLAVKGLGKASGKDKESTESSSAESTMESTESQITVDGVVITGMSQEEAKAAVLASYDWNMKVTYQDKEAAVSNLMEPKLNELLENIYSGEMKDSYEVNTDNILDAAKAEAAIIAGNWDMVPKSGGISSFNKDTGKFDFSVGEDVVVIDQDKIAGDIVAAIVKKDYKAMVTAQTRQAGADMSADQLKEKYKTISTYTTKTTSNSNRNENIRLACNALNGTIINPGQEFSFNKTTGARTEAKGYKPANAYLNGEIVQEPGGGVCQVSSTLYNSVVFAGLTSTERHAHSYEPSYVTPGEDAAVSYGGPDFKFVNSSDYPVAIRTDFASQVLTISIYGVPVVKEGTKVRMSSEKTDTLGPPAPTYEEDQTLQPGEEKAVTKGTNGSRWATYLVTYEGDKEVSREFFHNSSYRGKAGVTRRNTSGVVVLPTESAVETLPIPSVMESQNMQETTGSYGPAGPGSESKPVQPAQPGQISPGATVAETTSPVSPGGNSPVTVPPVSPVMETIPGPGSVAGPGV